MKILIRVSAIVATCIFLLTLACLLLSIPLQSVYISLVIGQPVNVPPSIPLSALLNYTGYLLFTLPLIIIAGRKKGGIWIEILLFFGMVITLPLVSTFSSVLYQQYYYHPVISQLSTLGAIYVSAFSLSSDLTSFCTIAAPLAVALSYATYGMSIADQLYKRKIAKEHAQ